jgi:hypothetical protein
MTGQRILKLTLKEQDVCVCVDWINLSQDTGQSRIRVNKVVSLWIP